MCPYAGFSSRASDIPPCYSRTPWAECLTMQAPPWGGTYVRPLLPIVSPRACVGAGKPLQMGTFWPKNPLFAGLTKPLHMGTFRPKTPAYGHIPLLGNRARSSVRFRVSDEGRPAGSPARSPPHRTSQGRNGGRGNGPPPSPGIAPGGGGHLVPHPCGGGCRPASPRGVRRACPLGNGAIPTGTRHHGGHVGRYRRDGPRRYTYSPPVPLVPDHPPRLWGARESGLSAGGRIPRGTWRGRESGATPAARPATDGRGFRFPLPMASGAGLARPRCKGLRPMR